MTGEQLWTAFINSQVPDKELESLAHDLYFARKAPTGAGNTANNKLSAKLGLGNPRILYIALNVDPGRTTLETLGLDYEKRRPWATIAPSTRKYAETTAERISRVLPPAAGGGGGDQGQGQEHAQAKVAAAPMAAAAAPQPATGKIPLWPVVVGAIVIVGGLSYVSQKGQREIHSRIHREHLAMGRA